MSTVLSDEQTHEPDEELTETKLACDVIEMREVKRMEGCLTRYKAATYSTLLGQTTTKQALCHNWETEMQYREGK